MDQEAKRRCFVKDLLHGQALGRQRWLQCANDTIADGRISGSPKYRSELNQRERLLLRRASYDFDGASRTVVSNHAPKLTRFGTCEAPDDRRLSRVAAANHSYEWFHNESISSGGMVRSNDLINRQLGW